MGSSEARTYEQSCKLLDRIVGRCVRDSEFASAVLADPAAALAEYKLNEHELEDFEVLSSQHRQDADQGWSVLRSALSP